MTTFVALLCATVCTDDPLPRGAIAKVQLLAGAVTTITADGRHIVALYYDGGFAVFPSAPDKITKEELRKEFEGDCALSQNAKWIAVKAGKDGAVRVLQLSQLKQAASFNAAGKPVAISDDGTKVMVHAWPDLSEFDCASGTMTRKYECSQGRLELVRWTTDGAIIFKHGTGSSDSSDATPKLVVFGQHESRLAVPLGNAAEHVTSAAVGSGQQTLAVAYDRRHDLKDNVVLYDLRTGTVRRYLSRDMPGVDHCVSFNSSGTLLAVGGGIWPRGADQLDFQGAFRIYDAEKGTLNAAQTLGKEPIVSIRFLADEAQFVTSSAGGEVIVWDTRRFLGNE